MYMGKHTIPVGTPAKSIRSMLSMRLWIDFKIKFNAETLLRIAEILAACCMMNGNGASSKSLSSSATSKIVERAIKLSRHIGLVPQHNTEDYMMMMMMMIVSKFSWTGYVKLLDATWRGRVTCITTTNKQKNKCQKINVIGKTFGN